WRALPRNQYALVQAVGPIPSSSGLIDIDCTLLPLQVFLNDGKATTIHHVVDAVKEWMNARGFAKVLSAGRNNGDRIMPPEFLADGKPRREPANPPSSWTLTRDEVAGLTYSSPDQLKDQKQLFTVKGYLDPPSGSELELLDLVGDPVKGAEGQIEVTPGP